MAGKINSLGAMDGINFPFPISRQELGKEIGYEES